MSCKFCVQQVKRLLEPDGVTYVNRHRWLRAEPVLPDTGDVTGIDWTRNRDNAFDFQSKKVADEWASLVGGSTVIIGDPPAISIGFDDDAREARRLARVAERQAERLRAREEAEEAARLAAEAAANEMGDP